MMSAVWNYIKVFALLCGFWLALSGITEPRMLVFMALSSGATLAILHALGIVPTVAPRMSGVVYVLKMAENMLTSSIQTLKLTHAEKPIFSSDIVEIDFDGGLSTDIATVMHAAAITMTPGTAVIAVDKERGKMLVHGLDESMLNGLPDEGISGIIAMRDGNRKRGCVKKSPSITE